MQATDNISARHLHVNKGNECSLIGQGTRYCTGHEDIQRGRWQYIPLDRVMEEMLTQS